MRISTKKIEAKQARDCKIEAKQARDCKIEAKQSKQGIVKSKQSKAKQSKGIVEYMREYAYICVFLRRKSFVKTKQSKWIRQIEAKQASKAKQGL